MTYQEFLMKNEENQKNYNNAIIANSEYTPEQLFYSPFISFEVEEVDEKEAKIVNKLNNISNTVPLDILVTTIMYSYYVHVTNPSILESSSYSWG